ncbi:hypothetical protein N7527_009031 [Penicillium freii]|nr:hypothetical protein N7527_009031 [Penicillium freii]
MTTTHPPTTTNGTTTTYLPMTTPFTAPKECSVYFVGTESRSSTTTLRAGLAWVEYYKIAVNQSMTCFPPQFDEYVRFRSFLVKEMAEGYGTSHFTSTAMLAPFYCLDGWEVATSIVPSLSSTWSICCPSNSNTVTYASLASGTASGSADTSFSLITKTVSPSRNTLTVTVPAMYGLNIGPRPMLASTKSNVDSAGLSTGAKAGIGVGVAVGVLLVIGLLILLYIRRYRDQQGQNASRKNKRVEGSSDCKSPKELSGQSGKYELQGSHHHAQEMEGDHQQPQELAGWRPPELDSAVYR